jgi:hypothetical protein
MKLKVYEGGKGVGRLKTLFYRENGTADLHKAEILCRSAIACTVIP